VFDDLLEYVYILMDDRGFLLITDMDLNTQKGTVSLAVESVEAGMIIVLDIEWDKNGYSLLFHIFEGTLTAHD